MLEDYAGDVQEEPMELKLKGGESFDDAVLSAISLAHHHEKSVKMEFNGVPLIINGDDSLSGIKGVYLTIRDRQRREWEVSDEGKAFKEKIRIRDEKIRVDYAKPLMPPTLRNQEAWDEIVKREEGGYGKSIVRYAARWARQMEEAMSGGATLEEAAEATERKADLEGMSGASAGCAIQLLKETWIHGEELGKWNDKQWGREGKK